MTSSLSLPSVHRREQASTDLYMMRHRKLNEGRVTEELDSYLYQTVGQDAITYIAQAMDLPLHRRTISGKAVDQELQYRQAVEGDETEDLYELLIDVLRAHPDVKGVAVGAILSTYQRIRVEHVCARLGLTAIAYLWQRDQMELLDEMKEAGMDARIIKVAGAGLGVKHLNQNVAGDGMIGELTRLVRCTLLPCWRMLMLAHSTPASACILAAREASTRPLPSTVRFSSAA